MNTHTHNIHTDIDVLNHQDLTKHSQVDKGQVKYWDKDYINQHIDGIQNSKHKTLFFLLWRTGVRISEALGIRKRDIDFDNYTITIRWLKSRKAYTRNVPLQPELRNILSIYVSTLKADELVFGFSRQRADQLAKQHFKGNCHKFRHSFAINWLRQGCDLYLLSRMLGHSSIKITEQYLQVVPIDIGKELLKVEFN